jgi:hypothetical protein
MAIDQNIIDDQNRNLQSQKQEIFDYVRYYLGDEMAQVELEPVHYENAFKQAVVRYRQRSSNSVEESYSFLELIPDQNVYQLPKEIISVRQIFRHNVGSQGSGSQYDPFTAGFINFYMIQVGQTGGLATYYLYNVFLKETAKMFGGYINFSFNNATKQITLMRRPIEHLEAVILWTYNYKPDTVLLTDIYSQPWIKEYTLALCMKSLGYARGKFSSLPGPSGGTTLNGDKLLQDSTDLMTRLEDEINKNMEGSWTAGGIIIG